MCDAQVYRKHLHLPAELEQVITDRHDIKGHGKDGDEAPDEAHVGLLHIRTRRGVALGLIGDARRAQG